MIEGCNMLERSSILREEFGVCCEHTSVDPEFRKR